MRFTLFASPGRPVHSDTYSASPGSILARQQLRAKAKSLTFPPLSIARYSFIQLGEQGRQWRERKCPIFETVTKRDSNPGSLDCESGILPLSYRAIIVDCLSYSVSSSVSSLLLHPSCCLASSLHLAFCHAEHFLFFPDIVFSHFTSTVMVFASGIGRDLPCQQTSLHCFVPFRLLHSLVLYSHYASSPLNFACFH